MLSIEFCPEAEEDKWELVFPSVRCCLFGSLVSSAILELGQTGMSPLLIFKTPLGFKSSESVMATLFMAYRL